MTQETLGRLIRYCTTVIARLESGARRPDVTVVIDTQIKHCTFTDTTAIRNGALGMPRI